MTPGTTITALGSGDGDEGTYIVSNAQTVASTGMTAYQSGGALSVGDVISGTGAVANTYISSMLTGTGGIGTYGVVPSQTMGSGAFAAYGAPVIYDSISGAFIASGAQTRFAAESRNMMASRRESWESSNTVVSLRKIAKYESRPISVKKRVSL